MHGSLFNASINPSLLSVSSTFNSLFRVLCIFRSRYLYAIGLMTVFSVRRNLPPTLGNTLKLPDSTNKIPTRLFNPFNLRGSHPLWRPIPGNLIEQITGKIPSKPHNSTEGFNPEGFRMRFSHFTRSYYGNHCYFLLLPWI